MAISLPFNDESVILRGEPVAAKAHGDGSVTLTMLARVEHGGSTSYPEGPTELRFTKDQLASVPITTGPKQELALTFKRVDTPTDPDLRALKEVLVGDDNIYEFESGAAVENPFAGYA